MPFKNKTSIKSVSFEWKFTGKFNQPTAKSIKTKAGDDAILRIGLILLRKPRILPFFAPNWIKEIANLMKFPAGELIYLNPHAPLPDSPKWHQSTYSFDKEPAVIGIWIMSDGDNTFSTFEMTYAT